MYHKGIWSLVLGTLLYFHCMLIGTLCFLVQSWGLCIIKVFDLFALGRLSYFHCILTDLCVFWLKGQTYVPLRYLIFLLGTLYTFLQFFSWMVRLIYNIYILSILYSSFLVESGLLIIKIYSLFLYLVHFCLLSFSMLATQSKLITLTVTTVLFYSTCILVLFFRSN